MGSDGLKARLAKGGFIVRLGASDVVSAKLVNRSTPRAATEPADAPAVYDRATIWLHWSTALLVGVLWTIGRTTPYLPRGPLRLDIWSVHVLLGLTLAGVLVARIVWRLTRGRILPPADQGPRHILATATHGLLYLLLVAVVALGITNAFAHGFPLFGVLDFPKIGSGAFMRGVNRWHDLAANAVAVVALGHAAAALFHHYVLGDGLIRRMWPASAGR